MSRIGRTIITIPSGVEVTKTGDTLTVKGPNGTLVRDFKSDITITIADGTVAFAPVRETVANRALWGTYASHVVNMVDGVTKGFERKLLVEGVGYKWSVAGTNVVLDIGFSHTVNVPIPEGVKVVTEKNAMTVSGIDKEKVGQFAAVIRGHKRVEPYKGKGIRYEGEVVRRKQGKKSSS